MMELPRYQLSCVFTGVLGATSAMLTGSCSDIWLSLSLAKRSGIS